MTDLLVVWSLDGRPLDQHLSHRALQSIVVASGPHAVIHRGDGWLARTREGDLHVDANSLCIALGVVCGHDTSAAARVSATVDAQTLPEGHFVFAHINRIRRKLTIGRAVSGGERLFYCKLRGCVLVSSSLRVLSPLVADCGGLKSNSVPGGMMPREPVSCGETSLDQDLKNPTSLDLDSLEQMVHCGHVLESGRTVFEGISELLPGHHMKVIHSVGQQRWQPAVAAAMSPPEGPPREAALRFRQMLTSAIEASVIPGSQVAVALSGGIDSSAIAAGAVDVVGANQVTAFSYEFDDPRHDTETRYAREVCQRLGIKDHRVFKVNFQAFIEAIPESVWRSESPVYWPKSFLPGVASRIRSEGFDRYLSGFGIGSHMGYLQTLATQMARSGFTPRDRRNWQRARFEQRKRRFATGWWWQCAEPPHPRLYYPLVRLLAGLGLLDDPGEMFPRGMAPLLRGLAPSALPQGLPALGDLSVAEREDQLMRCFSHHCVAHLLSCVDVTRSERTSRENGAARISPGHYPSTLPFAYFPMRPAIKDRLRAGSLRPGKYLLRLAYADALPASVLYRKKSWADAVVSPGWMRAGRRLMQRALPEFPEDLAATLHRGSVGVQPTVELESADAQPDISGAIRLWEPQAVQATSLSTAFFLKLMTQHADAAVPPRWEDLIPGYRFRRTASPMSDE